MGEERRSNATEIAVGLFISWLSTSVMGLTVEFIIPEERWMYYSCLPIFHPISALFLGLYYNWCHTWRGILSWRIKMQKTIIKLKRPCKQSSMEIQTKEKQIDLVRPISLLRPMVRMFIVVYNNYCPNWLTGERSIQNVIDQCI